MEVWSDAPEDCHHMLNYRGEADHPVSADDGVQFCTYGHAGPSASKFKRCFLETTLVCQDLQENSDSPGVCMCVGFKGCERRGGGVYAQHGSNMFATQMCTLLPENHKVSLPVKNIWIFQAKSHLD